MKKLMLVCCQSAVRVAMLSLMPALGFAESGLIDFDSVFKATRVGTFVDQHLENRKGIYATLLSFHDKRGLEYANLNVGFLEKLHPSPQTPLFQCGLRLDNLLSRAVSSDWGQFHVRLAPLPHIEFGPFLGGYLTKESEKYKINLIYGIGISVGL